MLSTSILWSHRRLGTQGSGQPYRQKSRRVCLFIIFFYASLLSLNLQAYLWCHIGWANELRGNDANHDGRKPYSSWCNSEALAGLQYAFSSSSSPRLVSNLLVGKEKQLPKPQRRGAIIILGMLALAKRSVLTDKVDVMLKVGLGPLGKVWIESKELFSFYLHWDNRRIQRWLGIPAWPCNGWMVVQRKLKVGWEISIYSYTFVSLSFS